MCSATRVSGHRRYPPEAVSTVGAILFFRDVGFTLGEIGRLMTSRGQSPRAWHDLAAPQAPGARRADPRGRGRQGRGRAHARLPARRHRHVPELPGGRAPAAGGEDDSTRCASSLRYSVRRIVAGATRAARRPARPAAAFANASTTSAMPRTASTEIVGENATPVLSDTARQISRPTTIPPGMPSAVPTHRDRRRLPRDRGSELAAGEPEGLEDGELVPPAPDGGHERVADRGRTEQCEEAARGRAAGRRPAGDVAPRGEAEASRRRSSLDRRRPEAAPGGARPHAGRPGRRSSRRPTRG